MKILANDGLAPEGITLLKEAGFTLITEKIEQNQLIDYINNESIEMILVRSATKVRKDIIDACPSLKLIGRGGVGMDNIDVEYARSKGILVINTPSASSQSVAELVIAHLFGVCRFLYDSNRKMPVRGETEFAALKKSFANGIELRGKTLGIVGFGRIGQVVARYALGLGMKVVASDAFPLTKEIYLDFVDATPVKITIETISKEEVMRQSDFISLHTPGQSDGVAVIGKNEMEQMKDGAIIINASRGGILDEKALIEELESGKIAAAALDVFDNEPNPNPDLLRHPKISLTPHTGAATKEAQGRVGSELASQIIAAFQPV